MNDVFDFYSRPNPDTGWIITRYGVAWEELPAQFNGEQVQTVVALLNKAEKNKYLR